MPDHSLIKLFEQRAELLDIQQSKAGLDDALSQLAAWMDGLGANDPASISRTAKGW